jgi:hypothetical protein
MFSVGKAKPGFVCLGAVAALTVELQIQVTLTRRTTARKRLKSRILNLLSSKMVFDMNVH